jgi:uncharacterized membrane protein YbhN (UPF0104 family)
MSNDQAEPTGGRKPLAQILLRLAISALILAALFTQIGLAKIGEVLAHAEPAWLLIAFLGYNTGQIVSALRWRQLAHAIGFRTPARQAIRFYFIGMFFGIAVPSVIGTDGTRALYLGQEEPGRARAMSSVIGDRVVGLVTLMAIAALGLAFGPRGDLPPLLAFSLGVLASGALLVWILTPTLAARLPARSRLRGLVQGDLLPLFRHPALLSRAFLLSTLVHLLHIAGQKALTEALGLEVSWGFIAIYHPLVVLATAIPLTIGGFGLREATYALLLPYAGIAADDAVVLSLLWWTIGALGGLIGGLLYAAAPAAIRRPQDRD